MKGIDLAEMLEIGYTVKFVHSTNIEGEKKILQGKIKKILDNNCVLIEVINDKSYNGTLCNRNIMDIV
jgi:predicted RNA-binding protein